LAPVDTLSFKSELIQEQLTESSPVVYVDESSALTASQLDSSIPKINDSVDKLEITPRRSKRLAALVNSIYQSMVDRGSLFVVNGISILHDENPTLSQALKGSNRLHWIRAIFKELQNLEAHKTWRKITRKDLNGVRALHCKLVLRTKRNLQRKARLVILGNRDYSILGNVFAPTANQVSVLLLLAIVVFYRLKV
jgi:hypothetical protein